MLKWSWPPGRQAQMVSHSSLSGGPVGSGRRGWGTKALEDLTWVWLRLLEQLTALCSSCMRHTGQAWHCGTELWCQACLCMFTAEQPAGWISPVRSCRRVARPSWREHMAHSCYQMPTSSTITSSKALPAKMWHLNLLQEAFFLEGNSELHECHNPYHGLYTM